jgi:hypothetical protein
MVIILTATKNKLSVANMTSAFMNEGRRLEPSDQKEKKKNVRDVADSFPSARRN